MNLSLRLQNKTTFAALCAACVAFVYQVLGILGVVPAVGQDAVTNVIAMLITILAGLGILVDPTTEGITDNVEAMSLEKPAANDLLTAMPSGEVLAEEETASQEPEADIEDKE